MVESMTQHAVLPEGWHPGLPSHDCGVTGRLRVEMACMAHPAALRRPARRGPAGAHVVAHGYIPHVVRRGAGGSEGAACAGVAVARGAA